MGEIVAILTLSILVIAQLVERYFYSKQMTQKLSECIKAVMSRNMNEFITATQADRASKQEFTVTDEIAEDEMSDEEFDQHIEGQNK